MYLLSRGLVSRIWILPVHSVITEEKTGLLSSLHVCMYKEQVTGSAMGESHSVVQCACTSSSLGFNGLS
jgi:hypothetical protein